MVRRRARRYGSRERGDVEEFYVPGGYGRLERGVVLSARGYGSVEF